MSCVSRMSRDGAKRPGCFGARRRTPLSGVLGEHHGTRSEALRARRSTARSTRRWGRSRRRSPPRHWTSGQPRTRSSATRWRRGPRWSARRRWWWASRTQRRSRSRRCRSRVTWRDDCRSRLSRGGGRDRGRDICECAAADSGTRRLSALRCEGSSSYASSGLSRGVRPGLEGNQGTSS